MYKVMKDRSRRKDFSGLVPVFMSVSENDAFLPELFHKVDMPWSDGNRQWALHADIGSLTVLDRMTGFGWRDIETGYRAPNGDFWLASGGCDVRESGANTIGEAIDWVKRRSNTVRPEADNGQDE